MKIEPYIKTFVLVAIVLFFALQKGNGFGFLLLLPLFVVTMLYSFVQMVRRPGERKRYLIQVAIWVITLTLVGSVQIYWNAGSRADVDMVVTAVVAYRTRTGSYPASLKELGLNAQTLMDRWKVRYFIREGKAVLSYPAYFMPLTMYEYDFDTHKWRVNAY